MFAASYKTFKTNTISRRQSPPCSHWWRIRWTRTRQKLTFDAYHRSGFDPKRAAAYASHNPNDTRAQPRKN
jgi:hypothetical protein